MILPGAYFEAINGILAVMFAWVIAWFLYDVVSVFRIYGPRRPFYEEAAASIACLIAFTGDLMIRGAVWWLRHLDNDGLATATVRNISLSVVSLGLVVSIVGCACVIRHLAPNRLGAWPWLLAGTTALALGIGFAI